MARCVIVSACPVSPALAGLLRAEDYLIACDAGYCNCKALGRQPDTVVGDFDSAPRPQTRPGEALVVLPHVKDDTDTQYAYTRPIVDHMFRNYDGVLKVDGEVGNKKTYDPRVWGAAAEAGMAARVVEAAQQLGSAGTSGK